MSFSMKKALEINRYALQGTMGTSAPPITVRKEQGAMLQVDYRLSPSALAGSDEYDRDCWVRECIHATYPDAVGLRKQPDCFGFFLPGPSAPTGTETAELAARLLPALERPEPHGVGGLSSGLHFLAAPLPLPGSTAFRPNEEIIHVNCARSLTDEDACQVQFDVVAGLPPGLDLRNIAAGLWRSTEDWSTQWRALGIGQPFGFRVGRKAVVFLFSYAVEAGDNEHLGSAIRSLARRFENRIGTFSSPDPDRETLKVVTSATDHPQFCYLPIDIEL